MKRKLHPRERWFLAFAPTVLILGIYVFGLYRPWQAELAEARQRSNAARARGTSSAQVGTKRQIVRDLQNRLFERRQGLANASFQPVAFPPASRPPREEAGALLAVTQIFKEREALLLSAQRLSESDTRNMLPGEVADALKRLPDATAGVRHGMWRVDLAGRFEALRASMNAIALLDELVLPLSIAMEPSPAGDVVHNWSLWVWM